MPSLEELELRLNAMAARVAELEDGMSGHVGIDYGAAQQLSPHPSQQIEVGEFGGGAMRLDKNGIQIDSNGQETAAIYWVNDPTATPPAVPYTALSGVATTTYAYGFLRSKYTGSKQAYLYTSSQDVDSSVAIAAENLGTASITATAKSTGEKYVHIIGPLFLSGETSDPAAGLSDGMAWYRSDTDKFRARANGVTENLATEANVDADVAAHEGLADPHTGYVLESLIDAKGDLIAGTAADTVGRLALGANNKVLVAASGETTGLKWAFPNVIGDGTLLTIATGAITATSGYHILDTEAAAATDDLDTINGGETGEILVIRATNAARTVVAKNGTGNMLLAGDFSMDNSVDTLTLIHYGGGWLELARSNNGA